MDAEHDAEHRAVVFLMGATATGKTACAAGLYARFACELVSVDAGQIYRNLDIGTAKPPRDWLAQYPHHLIDICDYTESYSVTRFYQAAMTCIADITRRGKTPILVGGTMFYFRALERGIAALPATTPELHAQLADECAQQGLAALHQQLQVVDPHTAARIAPTDRQRILRALAIHRLSGVTPTRARQQAQWPGLGRRVIKLALANPDRHQLHTRIATRFKQMLAAGLVAEVANLLAEPDDRTNITTCPAMRSVGYRQVIAHLHHHLTYDSMRTQAIAATRQLAKRQLTWLRNQSNVVWFDATHPHCIDTVAQYWRARGVGG